MKTKTTKSKEAAVDKMSDLLKANGFVSHLRLPYLGTAYSVNSVWRRDAIEVRLYNSRYFRFIEGDKEWPLAWGTGINQLRSTLRSAATPEARIETAKQPLTASELMMRARREPVVVTEYCFYKE
jgi:hypothetical protein